ncbi:MAG TPA: hypothetical protein VFG41_09235 [Sphingomicrobium sp.]|jgi:hypothetical protein|nr:hypothetical protein [Sphingomicrobium sp.]
MDTDWFEPKRLSEAEIESGARYNDDIRAEVKDALLEAAHAAGGKFEDVLDPFDGDLRDELLAALWDRGYEVVPRA